ncbi:MAG TPA: ACT domain-containing protein [Candidatus Hydrothermia bacterium]|nr:ACT domain-containing protein [Candidatus Hydrothermae bacterium]MDD3648700.1 ACT domain-containing protein [Candidatus Hydrothermia bacterium]MDD5572794.1 ACT domain-containing protein [Candidatus Hydrothermia bacterium]HOK22440.1 ACT domain-containing protein [Candidatus Hydrothermia bacterium]HOL23147.1 ACT domain-containing protein [Candidatus Hydrothermia bacterium]
MAFPVEELWVNRKVVKVILRGVKDKPGIAAEVFEKLASQGINIELIVSGPSSKGRSDIAFLVLESQLFRIQDMENDLMESTDAMGIGYDPKVALLVFYGSKEISKTPGVASKIFNILAEAGVNIEMVSTSIDSISIVIREELVDRAVMVLSDMLGLSVEEAY